MSLIPLDLQYFLNSERVLACFLPLQLRQTIAIFFNVCFLPLDNGVLWSNESLSTVDAQYSQTPLADNNFSERSLELRFFDLYLILVSELQLMALTVGLFLARQARHSIFILSGFLFLALLFCSRHFSGFANLHLLFASDILSLLFISHLLCIIRLHDLHEDLRPDLFFLSGLNSSIGKIFLHMLHGFVFIWVL